MASKPLGYESLKWVLQYMDANQRFQISQHCPSIGSIEKRVPLKIDSLVFQQNHMYVNNTRYSIGIYRKYKEGSTPWSIQEENDDGGVPHEVNKFGIHDKTDQVTLMPGDIDIYHLHVDEVQLAAVRDPTPVEKIAEIERTIRQCEQKIGSGILVELIRRRLDEQRAELHFYQCWKDNVQPPYEHFIQITVACDNQKRIERYLHTKKFREARKQLTTFMFADRRSSIKVNTLRLENDHGILRLPVDVKFRVRGMQFRGSVEITYTKLSPVIDSTSYPLEVLTLQWPNRDEIAHPVVKQAELLVLSRFYSRDQILHILLRLTNKNVRVRFGSQESSAEKMIAIIQSWKATNRAIGTCYEFVFSTYEDIEQIFKKIENEVPEAILGEGTMTLPMSDTSQLEISYTKGTIWSNEGQLWTLKMHITPLINNF